MPGPSRARRWLEFTARWLAVAAVVFAPWLFGATDPWIYLLLFEVVGLGLIVWLVMLAGYTDVPVTVPGGTTALGLFLGFAALQALPVPGAVVAWLNPTAAVLAAQARALGVRLQAAGLPGLEALRQLPSTLSLCPSASLRSLYLLVMCCGVFLVLAHTVRHWAQLRRVAMVLVCSGFVMALIALVHKFSGSREIFWFRPPRYGGDIFGPFSNRNHFAAHMNLLFGVALGLLLSSRYVRDVIGWPTWRDRLAWLSSRRGSRMVLAGFTVVLVTGAVCASMSRGAILSLVATVGALTVAALVRRGRSEVRSGLVLALAMVLLAALWLGGEPLVQRLATLAHVTRHPLEQHRLVVTRDTWRLFCAYPLVGCGFGAFGHVFSTFQSPGLEFRWLHAHNDWAQLLAEGGAVGAGLFLLAIAGFALHVARRFERVNRQARAMVFGLLIGLVAIALHSLVDYSLRKPANALLLSAVAGLVVAGANLRDEGTGRRTAEAVHTPEPESLPVRPAPWRRALVLAVLVGLTVLMFVAARELRGELAFARFLYFAKVAGRTADPRELALALSAARGEAEQVLAEGRAAPDALAEITAVFQQWGMHPDLDRMFRTQLIELSSTSAALAVAQAPADYLTWLSLARACALLGGWDEAELCLEHARRLTLHGGQVRMFVPPPPRRDAPK